MHNMLRRTFTDPYFIGFRVWQKIVMFFIVGSCLSLTLESVQSLADKYALVFDWSEWITVAFFTIDATANIAFAPRPLKYIFSIWGFIDLISVLPSYLMLLNLTAVRGTKIIRLIRMARVLRVLKLAHAAAAEVHGSGNRRSSPLVANLKIYCIIFFAVLMISSTAMYYFEGGLYDPETLKAGQMAIEAATPAGQTAAVFMPVDPISELPITADKRFFDSIPSAMWWCIETMTTTGYGDMFPVTVLGRIIAAITMMCGLTLFAILFNLINKTMMVLLFAEKHTD